MYNKQNQISNNQGCLLFNMKDIKKKEVRDISETCLSELRDNDYLSSDHIYKFNEILASSTHFQPQEVLNMWGTWDEIRSVTGPHIQILPGSATVDVTHWICIYYDTEVIHVYDSLNSRSLTEEQKRFCSLLFPHNPPVIYEPVQQQENLIDCGVFAIAFATAIVSNIDPVGKRFDTVRMRGHLEGIYTTKLITPFPLKDDSIDADIQNKLNVENKNEIEKCIYNSEREIKNTPPALHKSIGSNIIVKGNNNISRKGRPKKKNPGRQQKTIVSGVEGDHSVNSNALNRINSENHTKQEGVGKFPKLNDGPGSYESLKPIDNVTCKGRPKKKKVGRPIKCIVSGGKDDIGNNRSVSLNVPNIINSENRTTTSNTVQEFNGTFSKLDDGQGNENITCKGRPIKNSEGQDIVDEFNKTRVLHTENNKHVIEKNLIGNSRNETVIDYCIIKELERENGDENTSQKGLNECTSLIVSSKIAQNSNVVSKFGRPMKRKAGRPRASNLTRKKQLRNARETYKRLHPEKVEETKINYNITHPDVSQRSKNKYKSTHPDVVRKSNKNYQSSHPEAARKSIKNYQSSHPEVVRKSIKNYQSANPEVVRKSIKNYHSANPEVVRKARKNYKLAHPDVVRESVKNYQSAHPEVVRKSVRNYKSAHPDVVRKSNKNYQAAHPEVVRKSKKRYLMSKSLVLKNYYSKYRLLNRPKYRAATSRYQKAHPKRIALKQKKYDKAKSGRCSTIAIEQHSVDELTNVKPLKLDVVSLKDSRLKKCQHCNVAVFSEEKDRRQMCCGTGRYFRPLPPLEADFYNNNDFLSNSRSYNNLFAFSALGVTHGFQDSLRGRGPSLVKIQGKTYHRIFDLNWNQSGSVNNTALYIDDGSERKKIAEGRKLNLKIIDDVERYLIEVNPLISSLRRLSLEPSESAHIVFEKTSRRTHGPILGDQPRIEELAGIIRQGPESNPRKVIIWKKGEGDPKFVNILSETYEALQYPLLFPHATTGWHPDLLDKNGKKYSQTKYYRFLLLYESRFTHTRRLGQEYFVDMFSRCEEERLLWVRNNQKKLIRVAERNDVDETVTAGNKVGKVYLPSSFTHSPRYMQVKMQNGMALVARKGKPSFFITITCNPQWEEIKTNLSAGQTASDRPDLCNRIFYLKLMKVVKLIRSGELFGKMIYILYVIEFQKRGLPHAHIALKVEGEPKQTKDIDSVVRATIPAENEAGGRLRELVVQHMVHGPCGTDNPTCPCMDAKTKRCSKNFPKSELHSTFIDDRGYVHYRRPKETEARSRTGRTITDEWIVPYNPKLLLLLECHCNVEIASSVKVIKYLFKYIHKGPDRVRVAVVDEKDTTDIDEIENYISLRYISASEALWRIMEYDVSHCEPSVGVLPIHLPDRDPVFYEPGRELEALENISKLTLYLTRPRTEDMESLTYIDFFEKYIIYNKPRKNSIPHPCGNRWINKRMRPDDCIQRIHWYLPTLGEIYYLRMLLVRFPAYGYDDLKTVKGVVYRSFQEAAKAHGLLDDDEEYKEALREASVYKTGSGLRQLFFCLIISGAPAAILWDEFKKDLSEDFIDRYGNDEDKAFNAALCAIQKKLQSHGKTLEEFGLPSVIDDSTELGRESVRWNTKCLQEYIDNWEPKLSTEQSNIYNVVIDAVKNKNFKDNIMFIDGPSGTGKTVLLKLITAKLRAEGLIVLCTASTGIAALNHDGGVTAHSMFRLPLEPTESSVCDIKANSQRADLIRQASLIIWDEAPMTTKANFEVLNRSLKDLCENNMVFGGKLILLAGDFRQTAPVIKGGSVEDVVQASIKASSLWKFVKIFHLDQAQRSREDQSYSKFILDVGEDTVPKKVAEGVGLILLDSIKIVDSLEDLIQFTYPPDILSRPEMSSRRAILGGTNSTIDETNKIILERLEGEPVTLYSADKCEVDNDDNHEEQMNADLLHTISQPGIPDHKLVLKPGCVCILMRNLSFDDRLVNGTKVIVKKISTYTIEAYIHDDTSAKTLLIPRILFKFQAGKAGVSISRRQFPLKLAYAMTVNKSQGQTIERVGVDLRDDVFAHGQLYVALGRVRNRQNICILLNKDRIVGGEGYTRNVVYKTLLI